MIPRTIKRYSSSSSASARAGIKNIILGGSEAAHNGVPPEELSYQTKTFEDGEASPAGGSPFGSRRSSLSSAAALQSRRGSLRSSLVPGMTAITPEVTGSTPARAFSSSTSVSSGASSDHPHTPKDGVVSEVAVFGTRGEASLEHGNYEFTPKELAAVKKRVEEEFLLKNVTRSPLRQRRPSGKVPYEHEEQISGTRQHPSGFVVPEPRLAPAGTPTFQSDIRPRPAELNRGIPESVITFADLKELATADVSTRQEKVPQEVRSADGRVVHPSGFIPPTPQHSYGRMEEVKDLFKPAVNLSSSTARTDGGGSPTHE